VILTTPDEARPSSPITSSLYRAQFVSCRTVADLLLERKKDGAEVGINSQQKVAVVDLTRPDALKHNFITVAKCNDSILTFLRKPIMNKKGTNSALRSKAQVGHKLGVWIDSSCRQGVCGSCKVRLTQGTVDMDDLDGLSDDERAQGFVLACCSRPRGATSIGGQPPSPPGSSNPSQQADSDVEIELRVRLNAVCCNRDRMREHFV
jgi:ferredoxin